MSSEHIHQNSKEHKQMAQKKQSTQKYLFQNSGLEELKYVVFDNDTTTKDVKSTSDKNSVEKSPRKNRLEGTNFKMSVKQT